MVNFDKFEEQIFFNTVRIENLTDKELGTGFLVQVKYDDTRVRHLLFSNKHVFWGKKDFESKKYLSKDTEKELQITIHSMSEQGDYSLGNIKNIRIKLKRGDNGYYENSIHEIDVACINVSEVYNTHKINMRSAVLTDFNNYDLGQIHAGSKVVFIGYPTGFYDKKHSLPVLRSGYIASIPDVDFNGLPQILLDAQVFPGSSGSPVFIQLNGQYKLLGIINAAQINPLQFIEIPSKEMSISNDSFVKKIPVQFIGLGMLFKISTINDICDQLPKSN
ncbi:MAG: trypsin-like serine peptidase [Candidatus Paceibacteria bacterium]